MEAVAVRGSHLSSCHLCLIENIEAFRDQKDMSTQVIEVTEFKSEVRFDLRGHWRPLKAMPCLVMI